MPPLGKLDASGSPQTSGELEDSAALPVRGLEAVVFLGGESIQRKKHVRVMGGSFLDRPFLHRRRHGVRESRGRLSTSLDRAR